jgi:hypothetical protein
MYPSTWRAKRFRFHIEGHGLSEQERTRSISLLRLSQQDRR